MIGIWLLIAMWVQFFSGVGVWVVGSVLLMERYGLQKVAPWAAILSLGVDVLSGHTLGLSGLGLLLLLLFIEWVTKRQQGGTGLASWWYLAIIGIEGILAGRNYQEVVAGWVLYLAYWGVGQLLVGRRSQLVIRRQL